MAIQTVKTGVAVNDGTGDDARTAFTKINQNFTDNANAASRLVGTAPGNVMEVGAFGLGKSGRSVGNITTLQQLKDAVQGKSQIIRAENSDVLQAYAPSLYLKTGDTNVIVSFGATSNSNIKIAGWIDSSSDFVVKCTLLSTANTSVDANGFIKRASPIVRLFADKIESNDEAAQQDIVFEKLSVGDYLVKGSTGFAQEGWRVETPKDANGNVLVAVIYEQLDNNDISVKTYAKKFDEETGDIVPNLARPRDIPSTRWIDLRLQALPQDDTQPFATE